eukprot:829589-Pelagomonas_calceolata.AAC.8
MAIEPTRTLAFIYNFYTWKCMRMEGRERINRIISLRPSDRTTLLKTQQASKRKFVYAPRKFKLLGLKVESPGAWSLDGLGWGGGAFVTSQDVPPCHILPSQKRAHNTFICVLFLPYPQMTHPRLWLLVSICDSSCPLLAAVPLKHTPFYICIATAGGALQSPSSMTGRTCWRLSERSSPGSTMHTRTRWGMPRCELKLHCASAPMHVFCRRWSG